MKYTCAVCGSNDSKLFEKSGNYELHRCQNCTFVFIPKEFYRNNDVSAQYTENASSTADYYESSAKFDRMNFTTLLKDIEKYKKSGTLLDVGSNIGTFVSVARLRGWNAIGIEPNPQAFAYAASKNLPMKNGFFTEELCKREGISNADVITMNDVIEHVFEPMEMLTTAYNVLKDDGIISVVTPNVDTFFGKKYQTKPLEHLIYFTIPSMKFALEKAGFEVISIKNTPRYRHIGNMTKSTAGFSAMEKALISFSKLPPVNWTLSTAVRFLIFDELTAIARKKKK
jgi:2-polyprenyl-3-methyl-5-hydroxy-6-metoxy-1,4-benzoquinol methylase/DNA-directed RNA polymerase subunit RPC12/RpoP